MNKTRILIADDHSVVRAGIRALLETESDFEVVGEAVNGLIAVKEAARLKPDVVIMDLMMPDMDGIETTAALINVQPLSKILILTTLGTSDGIARAFEAGALGAIMKSAEFSELSDAVLTVARGKRYVSKEISRILADDPPLPLLSPRQLQILEAIVRGLTNPDISKALGISMPTVTEHITSIFKKLGVANRAEAISTALQKHLLKI